MMLEEFSQKVLKTRVSRGEGKMRDKAQIMDDLKQVFGDGELVNILRDQTNAHMAMTDGQVKSVVIMIHGFLVSNGQPRDRDLLPISTYMNTCR